MLFVNHAVRARGNKNKVDRDLKNEATFKSYSVEDQVITITSILALSELFRLKANVLDIIEPTKKAEYNLAYVFTSRLLDMYRLWLIDTCKESKENSQVALKLIQRAINGFKKETFGKE